MRLVRLAPCLLALAAAAGGPLGAEGRGFDLEVGLDLGEVQQALGGALPASPCAAYATVANYSAVGADPRMRTALLGAGDDDGPAERAALVGLLDACGRAVGRLAASVAFNAHCGNLTAVAHEEAARNFSRGIVADRLVAGGPVPDEAAAAGLAPSHHLAGVAVLVFMGVALL